MKTFKNLIMLWAFMALSFGFAASAFSQPLSPSQIDSLVWRSMKTFDVPGMAVAVIKDGKIVLAKGYGVRSIKSGKKVDTHTLFAIASNSKAFTTASLAMLVDRGKMHWDDKVRKYIPEFQVYAPYVSANFTIRDLVTHRSGLGLGAGDLMIFPDKSNFSVDELIHNLRYLKPVSGFRAKFAYDNLLYIVAGEVIHRVSGMSWEEFVQKNIFDKLGMTESAPGLNLIKDHSDMADAHVPVNGKLQVVHRFHQPMANAAGGINSNINDLIKWVTARLNGGKYGDHLQYRLFSEKENREMFSPQTILPVRNSGTYNTHFEAYGLGWFMKDVKGYKQIWHTGGLSGMVTQITMVPELKLGIIVLTNQESGSAFHSVTDQILDGYLNIKGTHRVDEYKMQLDTRQQHADRITKAVWEKVKQQKVSGAKKPDLKPFTGIYRDAWFGNVDISLKNDTLWFASERSLRMTGYLEWYKGNTFIVKWTDRRLLADAFVLFNTDFSGKPAEIKMKPVSPLTDFSFDFQDLDLHRVK
jgi:CubicO group peptidase (beta-lactamase class C family)